MSDERKVQIDLNGCRDIFDVIIRTLEGEAEHHQSLNGLVSEDYHEGFLAGLSYARGTVDKTREVAKLGVFNFLFEDGETEDE